MRRVCLTGGIASGKSVVADVFAQLGARVVRADDLARALMNGPDLQGVLDGLPGGPFFDADGTLNRAALAEALFGSPDVRHAVNAAVHPRVYEEIERLWTEAGAGEGCFVVETALAVETGYADRFEITIVVTAPRETRKRRLVELAGLSPAQAEARLTAQLPPERLIARADYVIENTGTIDQLVSRAEALYREVCAHG